MAKENFSVIIPLLNEQDSLRELYRQLTDVAAEQDYGMELIFVDDGSTDGSWDLISELADSDERVFGVRLRRNFGKAAALSAGSVVATNEYVVTIDADLQDDPTEIPTLFAEMKNGFDVVSGWKKDRKDPWNRRAASKVFNWLVNKLTGVTLNDHNCGFKLYRREVFDEVDLYGGFHRFVPVLAAARGFKIGEAVVNHRKRVHGKSRYGSRRIIRGLLDLMTVCFLTGYSQKPQHLLGTAGVCSFLVGLFGLLYMAAYWVVRMTYYPEWVPLHQRPVVIYSAAALLLGSQLLTMGFLAELIVARDQNRSRRFAVRETAGGLTPNENRTHEQSVRAARLFFSSEPTIPTSTKQTGSDGR